MYSFAMIWGAGALLETADRLKYSEYIRDKLNFLDLPKCDNVLNVSKTNLFQLNLVSIILVSNNFCSVCVILPK